MIALSDTQKRALVRAYRRNGANFVCPVPGTWAAQTAMLKSLVRKGLITEDGAPVLTDEGRKIAAELDETMF